MSRGPKSEIEKKGLGKQIVDLRLEGMPQDAIASTLGLKQKQVSNYLKKQKFGPENLAKTALTIEITQEIAERHLGQAVAEAEAQVLESKSSPDPREKIAAMHTYLQAIDMLNKATGLYEKAKREAETAQEPVRIELVVRRDDG